MRSAKLYSLGGSKAAVVLAVLILTMHVQPAGAAELSQSLPFSDAISSQYYEYVQVGAVAAQTTLTILTDSNVSVSTSVMTSQQFNSFNNDASDLSDSIFLQNSTSTQKTLSLTEGVYYLVFYAYGGNANVSYNYITYPVDPYYYIPLTPPEPTGVASFGLYNESGSAVPYQVSSSEVAGIARVNALEAYNASAASAQSNISGATLQLNSVLVVNEQGGHQQVYWAQNTPDFVTAASQVAYGDNLWNFSVSGFMSNSTVTSSNGGSVASAGPGTPGDYYGQEISNSTYSLPLVLTLLMNETVVPGTGVVVNMGAQMLQNGTGPVAGIEWFDNITIHDPTVTSADFLVAGNQTVAGGLYYDSELIFGGENNGEETDFTQMNASLGIFYLNSASDELVSYPSLFSFGGDTAESADNLQVAQPVSGFSAITTGTPDYTYLGNSSRTLTLPLTLGEVTQTSTVTQSSSSQSSSSGQTSSSGAQTTSSATSTTSTSSSATSSTSTASSVAYGPSSLFAIAAVASAMATVLVLGPWRRRALPFQS